MESTPSFTIFALSVSLVVFLCLKRSKLHCVPAIGPSGIITSYRGALQYLRNAPEMIQAGYNHHKTIFRVPYMDKWMVVLRSPKLIEDLRKAHDDELSAPHGFGATLAVNYTLGAGFVTDPYHVRVIQSSLTRNINSRFEDIKDEISTAFQDEIPLFNDSNWVAVPALKTVLRIVSRTSNRLFVGVELCRNLDYRDLNIEYAENVVKRARVINLFPNVLKPIVGPLLSPLPRGMDRAKRHLAPIVEERLNQDDHYGKDWDERPNDLISWLLEHATGEERTVNNIVQRILMINFVAIHTTANSFTQALYHLAEEPEKYVAPLRAEVEAAICEDGWSKASMGKCSKLDSFLRESQRLNGVSAINMNRMVVNPAGFTFSDGTHLPSGSFVTAATYATHHDDANYKDAEVFDGFRFARMRAAVEGDGAKFQMVTPDSTYLSFGLGRHACPGRFFAVTELKMMLAYILENYDVKLEQDGVRPPSEWFGTTCGANRTAKVLFRKRAAVGSASVAAES